MSSVHIGNGLYHGALEQTSGQYITRNGEKWYEISNPDGMSPFFVSLVSASNFWLYLSTAGGLTCGRVSCEKALFPYSTVDKIHDSYHTTGPCTVVQVTRADKISVWQPFVPQPRLYSTVSKLYKTESGDKIEFEELNLDLQVKCSYMWSTADEIGFIRKCRLENVGDSEADFRILDGLQNILPAGVDRKLQNEMSSLVDAYKWSEVDKTTHVGIYCQAAKPWDRAEPKESLKANVVYQRGLPNPTVVLSSTQLDAFRAGQPVQPEMLVRGKRGAYFVQSEFSLKTKAEQRWVMVAEVELNHRRIALLRRKLAAKSDADIMNDIAAAERASALSLRSIVAAGDGLQLTGDVNTTAHHFSNVMFNEMRGGLFDSNYLIHADFFRKFVETWNKPVAEQHKDWLAALPKTLQASELRARAEVTNDVDLIRLVLEYIPIFFSRRHGDPSRPWNEFRIELRDANDNKLLKYQGNWRDIFQNWEALLVCFPNFLPSIISKFVNASTPDGYNPYRISNNGIDWEVTEPHVPWSFIGYWGDHQIIYLLKFLEWLQRFDPAMLQHMLQQNVFAYANVPYLIRPYQEIVAHPKDTIVFDQERHDKIQAIVSRMGSDGRLVLDRTGKVYHVTLLEKLLVSLLAKLSNFVVEGGVWLNTQRPEWNDANNALVGNGISMVTTYCLRRWITFVLSQVRQLESATAISTEVHSWFSGTKQVFAEQEGILNGTITAKQRRAMLDALGEVAGAYRSVLYSKGFSGAKVPLPAADVVTFLESALKFVDHTIRVNRNPEVGLYHSYNLLVLGADTADIEHLYPMLEGQVCALSSGLITGEEAVAMLDRMRNSALYLPSQNSYLLYPDRELGGFMERNAIPAARMSLPGMQYVLGHGLESIAYTDCEGQGRFGDDLSNVNDLQATITQLAAAHPSLQGHQAELAETFERVFNHKAFTGRSGTMFSFEGLGCIYWHMCAKLLLAVSELCVGAHGTDAFGPLRDRYYQVREGLGGFNKSPAVYGAFPADPYSHTPSHAGAQQPGMTGQVKEEILARFMELGLDITDSTVAFAPKMLRKTELLVAPADFDYVDVHGQPRRIALKAGELSFTYCQTPVIYQVGEQPAIVITSTTGEEHVSGNRLDKQLSAALFGRTGEIQSIRVTVPSDALI